MHECEYCGEIRCVKRACIDAIIALADYYSAEAQFRVASAALDDSRETFEAKREIARDRAGVKRAP